MERMRLILLAGPFITLTLCCTGGTGAFASAATGTSGATAAKLTETVAQRPILLAARSGSILPRFQVVARITRNKFSVTEEYYTVNAPTMGAAKKITRTKIKEKYSNVSSIKFVRAKRLD